MPVKARRPAHNGPRVDDHPRSRESLSEGAVGAGHVLEMQRSRLLAAAVGAVDEWGYEGASVARITERARVSRRTFYEIFENREDCLLAVMQHAIGQLTEEIVAARLDCLGWRERVRGGLWVILCFLEREPALTRTCIVHSQRGGREALEQRKHVLDRLAGILDEGRGESSRSGYASELTAEGLVGMVLAILEGRLQDSKPELPGYLLGDLMGMIVLPYLGSAVARREQSRPAPAAVVPRPAQTATAGAVQALAELPMRLTYRTAKVLHDVGEHPDSSNRRIADRVDISDQGQMSKLLTRLRGLGLLVNAADDVQAKGEPNRWHLTPAGREIADSISTHLNPDQQQAA